MNGLLDSGIYYFKPVKNVKPAGWIYTYKVLKTL